MKPDWDKLAKNWNKGKRADTSLIGDVDCTAAGKPLCDSNGTRGFPTIRMHLAARTPLPPDYENTLSLWLLSL